MSETIELIAADGTHIPAHLARPAGKPRGGLVVVQEIFGVNRHIRAVADGYAKDGYLAVAPHIFHRAQPGVELGYSQQDIATAVGYKQKVDALPAPGILQDLQAAIDYATRESGGKTGIVGYCWGGLLAWRMACKLNAPQIVDGCMGDALLSGSSACGLNGLAAAVTYYGGGMTTIPEEVARQPKVPVLSHFADRDQHIPLPKVEEFKKQHPDILVYLYSAEHGFNCDLRDSWNPEAAKLARERTLTFLAKHVG